MLKKQEVQTQILEVSQAKRMSGDEEVKRKKLEMLLINFNNYLIKSRIVRKRIKNEQYCDLEQREAALKFS